MMNKQRLNKEQWLQDTFEKYGERLLRYAVKLTRHPETAREVVQDSFVKLCDTDCSEFYDDCSGGYEKVAPWLFTVCRNRIFDLKKREKRMIFNNATEMLPDDDRLLPSGVAQIKQSTNILMGLVDQLPENQREVVILKFQGDLSYKEIAQVTNLSVSNVGFLIHKGLAKLRDAYKTHEQFGMVKGGAR